MYTTQREQATANKPKTDCFAYGGVTCKALTQMNCNRCNFYKPRTAPDVQWMRQK